MQQGKHHAPAAPPGNESFPLFDEQPGITWKELFHHTGFGIKLRFLLALTLIALLPSILLVLILGDPMGSGQHVSLGRNTPLLLLGIFVLVVLVATWIALPIIRPIRRATRVIESTTADVRKLAHNAKIIAEDHTVGTTILSSASKRLSSRRRMLIRNTTQIARTCQDTLPVLQDLHYRLQGTRDPQTLEELKALYQSFQAIHSIASTTADELGKDIFLDQLDQAMVGAREIAQQFEDAGKQLEQETARLELAAQSLI
ncbi:MAG TPA: hypothetical protein VF458_21905 [Ktedonobacteraceae bacterium]